MRETNLTNVSPTNGAGGEPEGSVTFTATDRIVESADGYFIPRRLFGEGAATGYREETGPDGLTVTVFALKEISQVESQPSESRYLRDEELGWLDENRENYAGKWVALDGSQLLASGTSALAVYEEARKMGITRPFVTRVQAKPKLPFGGW